MKKQTFIILLVILLALALRLPGLSFRTMHGDEAVNAFKFEQLISTGTFSYNSSEYHGPAFYYFTLPLSWISGQNTLQELNETTLRLLPVILNLLLLFILFFTQKISESTSFLVSALLLAVSPIFVFYSRYYIHEMLLVFALYGFIFSGYYLLKNGQNSTAIFCGFFLGLCVSTKETWIIYFGALVLSVAVLILFSPEYKDGIVVKFKTIRSSIYIAFFTTVIVTVTVFYSSFFKDFGNFTELINSFSAYLDKSVGTGTHTHPWYMYFKWLFYFNGFNNFPGELPVAIGAVYGIYHLFFKEPKISGSELFFYKVLALFLLFSVIFFSVIPYKTPWNALGFWLTALILAGYGFVRFYQIIPKTSQKIIFIICISSGFTFLLWQSYYLNFKIYEQPENPFTYAQPLKDINKITGVLNTIKNKSNGNLVPHIDIIVKNSDYWPLPWSLRNFTKIGWWYEVDKESPLADIIIIDPDLEEQLINKIIAQSKPGHFRLYIPLYKEKLPLRPDHFLQVFVTYKIWEEYLR